jgi:hypothetical protein
MLHPLRADLGDGASGRDRADQADERNAFMLDQSASGLGASGNHIGDSRRQDAVDKLHHAAPTAAPDAAA